MIEKSLKKLILWAILFQGMYKINSFLSVFNKSIALLVTISLLSITVFFNIDENVKQDLNTICKATSISDYYRSVTNFSYNVINKILESTNIFLTNTKTQKENKDTQKKETNKENLAFVKTDNENKIKVSKFFNNYNFCDFSYLSTAGNNFKFLLNSFFFHIHTLKLSLATMFCCYFARGNIDIINLNNIIKENRLV